jgi:hypothetical protein
MTDELNVQNAGGDQPSPDNVVTLTDLQNVLVVLDLASSRGAFRGPELEPVGQLYSKISKFLQAVAPQQPENGVEQSTTTTQGSEVSTAPGVA